MQITSGFAILDVKRGRQKLATTVKGARVPVTITGFVTCPFGSDDGTSIEFEVDVTSVVLGEPVPADAA